ncbi:MAG: dihydrofolate reductase family protein [Candidatus Methanomethylophilaceae archaeon]|nr:dihydrofolate reductase family protein [Candidatus Methanomethylophilaceae archaeon]
MRPFIHVNCAMSADGKIAGEDRSQVMISSEEDKARVKALRKKYDAILVGVGTVIADDPHLTLKGEKYENNPIRIVLDPHGRTPDEAQVLDDMAPTIMVTLEGCDREWDCEETIRAGKDEIDLEKVMEELSEDICIESILVEGGGFTISKLFKAKMVDRYTVFVGGLIIGGSGSPTPCDGDGWAAEGGVEMTLKDCEILGNGALLTFEPRFRSLPRRLQDELEIIVVLAERLSVHHVVGLPGGVLQDLYQEPGGVPAEGSGGVLGERHLVLQDHCQRIEGVYVDLAHAHVGIVTAGVGHSLLDRRAAQRASQSLGVDVSQYPGYGLDHQPDAVQPEEYEPQHGVAGLRGILGNLGQGRHEHIHRPVVRGLGIGEADRVDGVHLLAAVLGILVGGDEPLFGHPVQVDRKGGLRLSQGAGQIGQGKVTASEL